MWTIFAPTNLAFQALSATAIEYLMDDVIALTDLLLFHIAGSGQIYHMDDLQCDGELIMANGDITTTLCKDSSNSKKPSATNAGRVWYQVGAGNVVPPYPQITTANLPACNGIVHVIDQVLLFENNITTTLETASRTSPQSDEDVDDETTDTTENPSENDKEVTNEERGDKPSDNATSIPSSNTTATCSTSLVDVVCGRDGFSTLCTILILMGELDRSLPEITRSNFTLFAPNNEAFDRLGDDAIDYLLQPVQHNLLESILLFHFVPDLVLSLTELNCEAGPNSLLSMRNGYESRTVCKPPFIYQKGAGNEPESRRPEIIEADIMDACNGQ
jgi:transforming growth factor-beta-induced protein